MSEIDANADPYIYNGFPMNTPLDIIDWADKEEGIYHKLRWGIISASSISSDWIKSLQDVPGAEFAAVAARDIDRARASPTPMKSKPLTTPTRRCVKTRTWILSTLLQKPGITTVI